MKRKIITILLIALLAISSFGSVQALDTGEEGPQKALACMYWQDGSHRWQTGTTTTKHYTSSDHHYHWYDDGMGGQNYYTDYPCDIYNVTEKYCACGATTTSQSYSSSHCE